MTTQKLLTVFALGATLAIAGCSGEGNAAPADSGAQPAAEAAAPASSVPATGTVIEVKMITDGAGNYFEPSEITAKQGDVIRFVLASGVHNVSFPANLNESLTGLPQASPMLQLPGQTHDVVVDFGPGDYGFQCDPHAALGMVGSLTVR